MKLGVWAFSLFGQVVTALTNFFLSLLDACGMTEHFFYTLSIGLIFILIFRIPFQGVSIGDAGFAAWEQEHPKETVTRTSSFRTSFSTRNGRTTYSSSAGAGETRTTSFTRRKR